MRSHSLFMNQVREKIEVKVVENHFFIHFTTNQM